MAIYHHPSKENIFGTLRRWLSAASNCSEAKFKLSILNLTLELSNHLHFSKFIKRRIEHHIIKNYCPHLFDETYYLEQNPSIRSYRASPLRHFVKYGWKEERDPHPLFDITYYNNRSARKRNSINPLVHFHLTGRKKGISPTRWFDRDYYLNNNKDVRLVKIDPFDHFIKYGVYENRSGSANFDGSAYFGNFRDARDSGMPALFHYIRYGIEAGRTGVFHKKMEESHTRHDQSIDVLHALDSLLAMEKRETSIAAEVDVVIPVHNDYFLTLACIHSTLKMLNEKPAEIVVVDDCSPEPAIRQLLEKLAEKELITLISHDENRGFVKSVNDGMRLHPDRDVVLLNSDTEVFGNWIDRLASIAYARNDIATVTPLTNSGTICSYPNFLEDNSVPSDCTIKVLDQIASKVNDGTFVEAPTAVGFCMYIKRAALNQMGYFDEEGFGSGYGEENDFSLRAQKAGWKDVIALNVVVQHFGGASFRGEKLLRVRHAMEVIGKRYPTYHADVQEYIKRDPAQPFRARLDVQRLHRLKKEKNVLIVSHERGGGTEQHVQERVELLEKDGWSVFRLHAATGERNLARVCHNNALVMPNMASFDLTSSEHLKGLATLLAELSITEIEIHHLGDFRVGAPNDFLALAGVAKLPYRFIAHDYLAICPRINLVDNDGLYCGEPGIDGCKSCIWNSGTEYGQVDISTWRTGYREFLTNASEILVPSKDVKNRLHQYFNGIDIKVKPHDLVEQAPFEPGTHSANGKLRVGIIGAISPIKGLDVICKCARLAARKNLGIEFVVIGYTSNDIEAKRAGLAVTGAYENKKVFDIIKENKICAIFMSSIWPETYSYTLSIALRSGLPIIAFGLGAIQERLETSDRKLLIPIEKCRDTKYVVTLIQNYVGQSGAEEA